MNARNLCGGWNRSWALRGNLRSPEPVGLNAVRELRIEGVRVLHVVKRPGAARRRVAHLEIRRVGSFQVARDEILARCGGALLSGSSLSAEDHDPGVAADTGDGEAGARARVRRR